MNRKTWSRAIKLNIHGPGTGLALIFLALTQVPVAIKTAAELACIGEVSNQLWKETQSHKNVNVLAIQKCNGTIFIEKARPNS